MKDFELSIAPVETYEAPEIPVFGSDNSALLKKLPSRWQKNAKIVACIGIAGTLVLSGCRSELPYSPPHGEDDASEPYYSEHSPKQGKDEAPIPYYAVYPLEQEKDETPEPYYTVLYPPQPLSQDIFDNMHNLGYPQGIYSGYSEYELVVRIHQGGDGASFYVVHLTEQEAYGIIRARLEAVGFNFSATPPEFNDDRSDGSSSWFDLLGITLFDEQKNVGVSHLSWEVSNRRFTPWGRRFAMFVEDLFAGHTDITVGALFTPSVYKGSTHTFTDNRERIALPPPEDEDVERSHPVLVGQLISQIDMFIFLLQSDGILGQYQNIDITINETSVIFSDYPILINNFIMVPAPEIFEKLGMTVGLDEHRRMTATKGNTSLTLFFSTLDYIHRMRVNDEWVGIDLPLIHHNDQILVPLQFIARTIGADVEWDEIAREIRVTTN